MQLRTTVSKSEHEHSLPATLAAIAITAAVIAVATTISTVAAVLGWTCCERIIKRDLRNIQRIVMRRVGRRKRIPRRFNVVLRTFHSSVIIKRRSSGDQCIG